jgi:cytochrome c-type biogenesis protein CcmH
MTIFWVIAAIITIIVLLILIIPMLRSHHNTSTTQNRTALNVQLIQDRLLEVERDYTEQRLTSEQYKIIEQELQLALAKDLQSAPDQDFTPQPTEHGRWMAWVVMLFVPILAVSLYLNYGDPRGFDLPEITQAQADQPEQQPSAASIEKMVDGLAARLKQNPDDQQGWFMLGRSYMVMGRYTEASNAYAQLLKLVGDDANVLLQYTQAKVMGNGGRWDSSSIALLEKAARLEPENPVTLSLSGLLAAQQGKAATAVNLWRKAQNAMQPNSAEYNELDKMIASANKSGAIKTENTQPAQTQTTESIKSPPQTNTTASGSAIEVEVSIAPELIAKASPEQTIFIFAQALSGPPMPIAVVRKKVSELPVVVTLDDSMAMMPTRKLSSFEQVRIAARISQSGTAMPTPGDLQGKVEPVDTSTARSVSVVIDQVL